MFEKEKPDKYLKIEGEIQIDAPPEEVFEALTTGLDAWWPFRTREDAKIVYEPKPGGMIYEDWGKEGFMLYSTVAEYNPPRRSASLGPGGVGPAAFNSRNIDIVEPDGKGGSIYKKRLNFWGVVPEETVDMYTQGSGKLSEILKEFLEG